MAPWPRRWGRVIEISPNSRHHINPLEMGDGYGDGESPSP